MSARRLSGDCPVCRRGERTDHYHNTNTTTLIHRDTPLDNTTVNGKILDGKYILFKMNQNIFGLCALHWQMDIFILSYRGELCIILLEI